MMTEETTPIYVEELEQPEVEEEIHQGKGDSVGHQETPNYHCPSQLGLCRRKKLKGLVPDNRE